MAWEKAEMSVHVYTSQGEKSVEAEGVAQWQSICPGFPGFHPQCLGGGRVIHTDTHSEGRGEG